MNMILLELTVLLEVNTLIVLLFFPLWQKFLQLFASMRVFRYFGNQLIATLNMSADYTTEINVSLSILSTSEAKVIMTAGVHFRAQENHSKLP